MAFIAAWQAIGWAEEQLPAYSGAESLVPHFDALVYDPKLGLSEVVEMTLANFPGTVRLKAFGEEARAWRRRSGSVFPGPLGLAGDYSGADTGNWAISTELIVPLWKWGQQATAKQVSETALKYAEAYASGLRLEVAGLVREALWELKLKEVEYAAARKILELSERLFAQVKRRVEVGDLPRTDLLLAETDLLKLKSEAVAAEAELMHARWRYLNLTQIEKAPANFEEVLKRKTITPEHPLIFALTLKIEEEQARMQYARYEADVGDQQILLSVGSHHEHVAQGGETVNSLNARLSIPLFGGGYQAPNVAAVRVAVAELEAQRAETYRQLTRDLHEAEYLLQVDQIQLEQAETRRKLAEANLELSRKAFEAGEMDLIDLLKVQLMAQEALRDFERWQVQVKRDVARYNQVVGELP